MSDDDKPSDEAFFARWSRRKQQAKPGSTIASPQPEPTAVAPPTHISERPAEATPTAARGDASTASNPLPKPLTEADFDDVDFNALTYGSDYSRFTQAGVPESIRQKALQKLWHSDPMFTAVDPFQDYAGDYTDAAVVPKSGIVKTAYKVGQGFLTDAEAHEWHRLGKPPLAAETTALAVLVPGYRVRPATAADGPALLAVHRSAILDTAGAKLGSELAASWAQGLTAEGYGRGLADGETVEIALDEETSEAVAFCGRADAEITGLFVHARRARRGLGRAMLARTLDALRAEGRELVTLDADSNARTFYEAQGFGVFGSSMRTSRGGLMMEVFEMVKFFTSPADLTIISETPDQPEVHAFLAASEAYASALYPAESNHFVDVATLLQPNVVFLVARSGGRALGCGAIVKAGDRSAEIKRMWVAPEARGLKLGQRLLDALITEARSAGLSKLQLETGISQPEALGLYRRAGFVDIAPFGTYKPDPLSVFMELVL